MSLWGLSLVKRSSLKASSSNCWHGHGSQVFSIEEKEEYEEERRRRRSKEIEEEKKMKRITHKGRRTKEPMQIESTQRRKEPTEEHEEKPKHEEGRNPRKKN